ncbi:hypothetical protein DYBT9275_00576 [Dyadobacter sp. CECT 9275]|uniref:NAD(P)-binding domain-containing protein n=1 Tax=Dyadobacter helix TaxID=2822344 RepID=A0A916NAY1_9BACT|nr:NAD(P)H-binding protein [Dyadobacter sp. CECT 9275]CAG4990632.1 hypothetical protein DYBT9275_00576 [Dyadobacter sp. CECT 9275]
MRSYKKIAVIGGGGKTGKFLVKSLLTHGFSVKLLLRHPADFTEELLSSDSEIEIIQGDAINPQVIYTLLRGCDAVMSTLGQRPGEPLVNSVATVSVLAAMTALKIRRYMLVAGLNVDTPFDKKGTKTQMATDWMKTNYPEITADRQKTYELLRESDVEWTLVRLPMIEYADLVQETGISLEDSPGDKISAGEIARFMIAQLTDDAYVRQAPFIAWK